MFLGGILLVSLAATFFIFIRPPQESEPRASKVGDHAPAPPVHYEENGIAPPVVDIDSTSKKPGSPPPPSGASVSEGRVALPPVAIVIDDMGYQLHPGDDLLRADLNLTFAFLPHGPHTKRQAELASSLGREILLHFPMEAADPKWDPGPGTITLDMSRAQLRRAFETNLSLVPMAVGINNHMGSRFTQNHEVMRDFLELVAEHRLFFLDSMTSQSSVGYYLAREMGVRSTRRHVFLDNVRERARIVVQIRELLRVAGKRGWAVGIGHPYPQTLDALRDSLAEIKRNAEVVPVSSLVH